MYDLIIIGGGPAGITAAVYAARKGMNFILITKDIGGQTLLTSTVENYTGYQFISGMELVSKFEEHMRKYNIPIKENETAVDISKQGDTVIVKTGKGVYNARAVIIASGKRSRELGVPGENEFHNRGLTYCATCDGPLFAGKDVAVIGGGNSALDATLQLINIARKIYLIDIAPVFKGDAIMQEKIKKSNKVVIFTHTRVLNIQGDKMITGITVQRKGKEENISVQGIFVEIGLVPNSEFTSILEKNEDGEIIINCSTETNVPGIFAAGDVTNVQDKQIIIAAGEGSKATLSAFRYISRS